MDPEQYFTNLVLAAMVDGELDESEVALLERHAENLRLGQEKAQEILERVHSGELSEFVKPRSPEARKAAFRAVVRILRADRKITRREQAMIHVLADKMEIPADMVDAALSERWEG
ncbi:MAG: hypothetical protein D6731_03440 [Planctomycetota bacterium]|nr:MAG: hypothetical protein D6731_03440 [Planctomycetota bacterium]